MTTNTAAQLAKIANYDKHEDAHSGASNYFRAIFWVVMGLLQEAAYWNDPVYLNYPGTSRAERDAALARIRDARNDVAEIKAMSDDGWDAACLAKAAHTYQWDTFTINKTLNQTLAA